MWSKSGKSQKFGQISQSALNRNSQLIAELTRQRGGAGIASFGWGSSPSFRQGTVGFRIGITGPDGIPAYDGTNLGSADDISDLGISQDGLGGARRSRELPASPVTTSRPQQSPQTRLRSTPRSAASGSASGKTASQAGADRMPAKHQPGCPCQGCGQSPSNCCQISCGPCSLPAKDLLLTWSNAITGSGSVPLVFNGYVVGIGLFERADVSATLHRRSGRAAGDLFHDRDLPDRDAAVLLESRCCAVQAQPDKSSLQAAVVGVQRSVGCLPDGGEFRVHAVYDHRSEPGPEPARADVPEFHGVGCNSLPMPGATVTVSNADGSQQLATGTTDSGGSVFLSWLGAAGKYQVAVSAPRFNGSTQVLSLVCQGVTSVQLTAYPPMSAHASAIPLPMTLHGESSSTPSR